MTSSLYDPYELGNSCATMVSTEGNKGVSLSEAIKDILVQIALCNSRV
jgi:hypothetical protein